MSKLAFEPVTELPRAVRGGQQVSELRMGGLIEQFDAAVSLGSRIGSP